MDPVKVTMSTSGCRPRAWPAVVPKPGTTLNTPGGRPASAASSAMRITLREVNRAGLSTTLLPPARAGPIFHAASWAGKFHGVTQATTPTGSRTTRARFSWAVGATWW